MADGNSPFTDEELDLAAAVPLDDGILLQALRIGTRALSEFGQLVMEPVFRGQIGLSDRELAIGTTFYRLLAAVRTLADLDQTYQFQAMAGCTRLIFELCVDTDILTNQRVVRAVEKFHGFTRAARFSAAFKTVAFYERHPHLEDPGDAEHRRALVETPGVRAEIETLCQDLWATHKAPEHWTGLRWLEQVRLIGPQIEEEYVQWSQLYAWLVHGGGAAVGGLPPRAFLSMEVRCRQTAKSLLPEAYRSVAVAMHMHRALPNFFDELARVKEKVETFAAIDAQLQTLGRKSKLS
jgi:hypothetical protein